MKIYVPEHFITTAKCLSKGKTPAVRTKGFQEQEVYFENYVIEDGVRKIRNDVSLPGSWLVSVDPKTEEFIMAKDVPMDAKAWDPYEPKEWIYLGRRVPYLSITKAIEEEA